MCDVGYLCTNFSLPMPLCSRVRPDVRDRQTDRRQTKASLNVRLLGAGHNNNPSCYIVKQDLRLVFITL